MFLLVVARLVVQRMAVVLGREQAKATEMPRQGALVADDACTVELVCEYVSLCLPMPLARLRCLRSVLGMRRGRLVIVHGVLHDRRPQPVSRLLSIAKYPSYLFGLLIRNVFRAVEVHHGSNTPVKITHLGDCACWGRVAGVIGW